MEHTVTDIISNHNNHNWLPSEGLIQLIYKVTLPGSKLRDMAVSSYLKYILVSAPAEVFTTAELVPLVAGNQKILSDLLPSSDGPTHHASMKIVAQSLANSTNTQQKTQTDVISRKSSAGTVNKEIPMGLRKQSPLLSLRAHIFSHHQIETYLLAVRMFCLGCDRSLLPCSSHFTAMWLYLDE